MELEWRDANELKSALLLAGVGQNTTIKCEKIKQFIFYSSSTCGRLLYMDLEQKYSLAVLSFWANVFASEKLTFWD